VVQPDGEPLPNSASRLGPGLDTRGQGGYVLAPPSAHPSGYRYVWKDRSVPVALCPAWLATMLRPAPVATSSKAPPALVLQGDDRRGYAYLSKAVQGELQRVLDAQPGSRNSTLVRASFALGQFVGAGALDKAAVADALIAAGQAVGLSEREASTTIASGMRAGVANPRDRSA
jgi:hypothetical protein